MNVATDLIIGISASIQYTSDNICMSRLLSVTT